MHRAMDPRLGITAPPKAGRRPPAPPTEVDVVVSSAAPDGSDVAPWLASWPSLSAYHLIIVLLDPAADPAKVALPAG